jgi:hypothetical protein
MMGLQMVLFWKGLLSLLKWDGKLSHALWWRQREDKGQINHNCQEAQVKFVPLMEDALLNKTNHMCSWLNTYQTDYRNIPEIWNRQWKSHLEIATILCFVFTIRTYVSPQWCNYSLGHFLI